MATLTDMPLDMFHRSLDARVVKLHELLQSLRGRAPGSKIREYLVEDFGELNQRTVNRDLWLLHQLHLVEFEEEDGTRYWRAKKADVGNAKTA